MAQFYGDENFSNRVIAQLVAMGHDVLTVAQAGMRGIDDATVLIEATVLSRIVLTFNRKHFRRLHRIQPNHAGIVSCTIDDDIIALAQRIHDAVLAAGDCTGQHIRVNKPPRP